MPGNDARPREQVGFCRSPDGARIAWSRHGQGPPLLVNTCWLSHLQHDWQSPVWRHFLDDLGRIATVIRYDERGFGLSDWDVSDFSFEARLADLAAVAEAAGLERFALLGMAQGGPVAIAYAHERPDRVSQLILHGTYAAWTRSTEGPELEDAFTQMIRVGWARPDPVFRRVFTNLMLPGASEEQMRWVDELQRTSTAAEVLIAARAGRTKTDVTHLLGEVDVPTLVLHARGDRMVHFGEGRRIASGIPGARFVPLDTNNHIVLADEPAWGVFMGEITAALSTVDNGPPAPLPLSDRELDVLRLAAEGLDNPAIAERLALSVRTVERHLTNTYAKLGVSGKVARAAAVAHLYREP